MIYGTDENKNLNETQSGGITFPENSLVTLIDINDITYEDIASGKTDQLLYYKIPVEYNGQTYYKQQGIDYVGTIENLLISDFTEKDDYYFYDVNRRFDNLDPTTSQEGFIVEYFRAAMLYRVDNPLCTSPYIHYLSIRLSTKGRAYSIGGDLQKVETSYDPNDPAGSPLYTMIYEQDVKLISSDYLGGWGVLFPKNLVESGYTFNFVINFKARY